DDQGSVQDQRLNKIWHAAHLLVARQVLVKAARKQGASRPSFKELLWMRGSGNSQTVRSLSCWAA
ncbi:MAG TPA: hypothetical protein VFR42_01675, partial [Candidatus Acidoferrum sp.]|nr:hypothetical protein [Candidatus Acidoferrum sp.]